MTAYTIENISRALAPLLVSIADKNAEISTLLTDSRSLSCPDTTLFFAIPPNATRVAVMLTSFTAKGCAALCFLPARARLSPIALPPSKVPMCW